MADDAALETLRDEVLSALRTPEPQRKKLEETGMTYRIVSDVQKEGAGKTHDELRELMRQKVIEALA